MLKHSANYDPGAIEPYWQSYWEKNKTFRAEDFCKKPKYYILDMFPYPSGEGLHVGHPEGYTASDILARYKKANGFNVLHPMGWDAFGLPAEQYAIKTGTHPSTTTKKNIDAFRRQIKSIGFAIDWDREINTTDPGYFKWTQWIFTQLFKAGLAYVDERPVWWCPELGTVLANEEVINGRSERGDYPVERRNLRQWVLRITAYAERLLKGLEKVDWPESTKRQQIAWIGRSEGAEVVFDIEGLPDEKLRIFTTRPDTLFGASYMVLAPEHPLVNKITRSESLQEVETYITLAACKSDLDRTDLAKEKSGVFTGSFAVNPVNGKKMPIWIADYVLMSYGTGAIMAVPAHDERDYEFACKYELPILPVIEHADTEASLPYTGSGKMVCSGKYDGLDSENGKEQITRDLEQAGKGQGTVNYKLRDWLFSRQRYWGEPIPIVWVNEDDYNKALSLGRSSVSELLPEEPVRYQLEDNETFYALPIPLSQLPLKLPDMDSYHPSGTGESPLANARNWQKVYFNLESGETISSSQGKPEEGPWVSAKRETNTMPQWAGSCWYYLRYCDPQNEQEIISHEIENYWKSPDFYIGGAEHAVLHLLYARFWHHALYDMGIVSEPEPFKRLFHQGIILGEDGNKMSKSRGNVINPDRVIEDYGADTLRMYEMFIGPLQDMKPWNTHSIEGIYRFLRKIYREYIDREGNPSNKIQGQPPEDPQTERILNETILKVTEDIEALRFNTAISQMMIFSNHLQKAKRVTLRTAKVFIQLLAPFGPHLAEELWSRLGEKASIVESPWPQYDPAKLASEKVKIIIQVNGKLRGEISLAKQEESKEKVLALAESHARVAPNIADKRISKVIYIPGKILNIVAN